MNCKQKAEEEFQMTYPEEELGVIKARYSDGSIAIGGFNRGYRVYTDKSKFPWSLTVIISLNPENCNPNGLPNEEETGLANQIEDELVEEISKVSPTHNVGHIFNDQELSIYLYTKDKSKIEKWLNTKARKENSLRSFRHELLKDKNWNVVEPFMGNE
ncbi:DUF695 domain-containing protein [Flagellimonas sp. S3867]|uniref:DUF695 domain-containing protein n=1 Tax=Flagellimonas sp. S3867 TaxID=2768063 RepID=UPI0016826318|nr:DUF695 domain-containing protein [Flagellimonas sp. S3867]